MQYIKITLLLLLSSFICSCTSDEQLQEISKDFIKVTAILPDWNIEDNSRTSITTGSYGTKPNPVWVTGDSIGIYPDAGGDQLSYRINEGGSKTCTFDGGGWAMKSASYTAYSPFKRSYYYEKKNALPISMLGQTQNGNDNANHLGAYDIQIAKGEKPEDGNLTFNFGRYVALLRLEITAPYAATWTSLSLESDALFTTEGKMNLSEKTPTITSVSTSNSVTLELSNVTTTNENLSIIAYMMLLPVDLTDKTISIKLTDSDGNTYTSSSASITNDKTNLTANSARWLTANFIPNNQIWYTSSNGTSITPYMSNAFGANIVSNVYENGKGIITFDGDVTMIGNNAFYLRRSLISISIPNSVTTIGDGAFSSCTSLTNMTISNNVTAIGESAFEYCNSLTNITIPNSVTTIEDRTFYSCYKLDNISLPNGVTTIGKQAFSGCQTSTSITIPNSVTTIGEKAFTYCRSLSNIIVNEENSFYDSRDNCNAIINTASNTLISGCKNTIIPNSVTIIGKGAFQACYDMAEISIPNSVIIIGEDAFDNCSSLASITIPNSVNIIGDYAFYNCSSLSRVNVKAKTPPVITSIYTFTGCNNNIKFYVPFESIETYGTADYWKDLNILPEPIPNNQIWYTSSDGSSITPYMPNAFGTNIISNVYENGKGIITFDSDVTKIGSEAFYNKNSLTSITIPNNVTMIGFGAFGGCSSLTTITIPNNVTEVVGGAFSGCTSLQRMTIPKSVTTIGYNPFIGCSSLEYIIVEEGNPIYDSRNNCNAIIETASNKLIGGCKNTVIPNSITDIGEYSFAECNSLINITIPNSVKGIWENAFSNCASLTTITIPNSVTYIGEGAFAYCKSLTNVTIPNSIKSIDYATFSGCSSLTDITIPNSVTFIGEMAFDGCSALVNITIPNSVTIIEQSAFAYCTSLSKVDVKAKTPPTIYDETFSNCSNNIEFYVPAESLEAYQADWVWRYLNILPEAIPNNQIWYTSSDGYIVTPYSATGFGVNIVSNVYENGKGIITFDNDVTAIGESAFRNSNISTIYIPKTVIHVNDYAFYGCKSLIKFKFPDIFYYIGERAFSGCTSLNNITLPTTVTNIKDYAFSGCSALSSPLIIPSNVHTLGNYAFANCTKLPSVTILGDLSSTGIGENAFSDCSSLHTIALSDGILTIGSYAFYRCNELTSIKLPKYLKRIKDYAFQGCNNLTTLTIPENVESIGKYAFQTTISKLTEIFCLPVTPPSVIDGEFCFDQSIYKNCKLYVPTESLNIYQSKKYWKSFSNIIGI